MIPIQLVQCRKVHSIAERCHERVYLVFNEFDGTELLFNQSIKIMYDYFLRRETTRAVRIVRFYGDTI